MSSPRPTLILPIFPLPDVTFFPHTLLPLHVFEARYRAIEIELRRRLAQNDPFFGEIARRGRVLYDAARR